MPSNTILNKKLWFFLGSVIFLSVSLYYIAQAAPNASVVLKKDPSVGLFILTIRDSDGIKDFSLKAPNKLPYSAGLAGCPKTFENNNVSFADPDDFTPALFAEITDCKGDITQLELLPPSDGISRGRITNAAPPPPAPTPAPVSPKTVPSSVETPTKSAETVKTEIVYPVAELNGCKDETECRSYCDDPANINACVTFAEKHNLISKDEADKAKKFSAAGAKGPGGCTSADSCESYCNDVSRIDECLAFAEKTGLMPPDELEEARKVQKALASGLTLPGGCKNKDECDSYCESSDHMEECIIFGETAGFIPPDELEDAKKVLAAVKAGAKPPPCRGKKSCDAYCSQPGNMESCLNFAEKAGLIPPGELEDAKKMLAAIKKGIKPPACGGKEECDVYCSEESHFNECLDFAEAAGFIAPEEVEMARKTGGKGPGNCRGREECEGFCQNPANQETCFSFAKEHGLISEEDLQRMEEGKRQILEMVDSAPPEVKSCLEGVIDVEGIRSGAVSPSESAGDNIRQCFEQFMPKPEGPGPNGGFPEGFQPPEGFEGGPPPGFEGGQPPEGFKPPEGMMPPEGFKPPEGMMPPEGFVAPEGSGEQFQQQFEQQYQQQYQQQFEQQSQQQYQQQFEQQYQQQYQQQFQQQEQQLQQQFQQPPPSEPTSKINTSILGAVVAPFLQLFGF